jgi:hypothetical protein
MMVDLYVCVLARLPSSELDDAVSISGLSLDVHDGQVARLNQTQLYFTWHFLY